MAPTAAFDGPADLTGQPSLFAMRDRLLELA